MEDFDLENVVSLVAASHATYTRRSKGQNEVCDHGQHVGTCFGGVTAALIQDPLEDVGFETGSSYAMPELLMGMPCQVQK